MIVKKIESFGWGDVEVSPALNGEIKAAISNIDVESVDEIEQEVDPEYPEEVFASHQQVCDEIASECFSEEPPSLQIVLSVRRLVAEGVRVALTV